jgi:hypothetical protein
VPKGKRNRIWIFVFLLFLQAQVNPVATGTRMNGEGTIPDLKGLALFHPVKKVNEPRRSLKVSDRMEGISQESAGMAKSSLML